MTKYEVESFGQPMSARYVVYSDTDSEAMKLAEKHHRPYIADGTWFGSTSLVNTKSGKRYTLIAGKENDGWRELPEGVIQEI